MRARRREAPRVVSKRGLALAVRAVRRPSVEILVGKFNGSGLVQVSVEVRSVRLTKPLQKPCQGNIGRSHGLPGDYVLARSGLAHDKLRHGLRDAGVPEDAWTVYIGATSDILSRRCRQWERLCTRLLTADSLSWREAADILGRRDPYGAR